jgi:hypothetical protein
MNTEKALKNCEVCLKQIKQYDPDPFYVNYFFAKYVDSVKKVFDLIFEEANRDFGLFILEKITCEKFFEKAKLKNDQKAIEFSKWYIENFSQEHQDQFSKTIKKICKFKNDSKKMPEIKIMIRPTDRYKDDICQQVKINLSNEKLRSKTELKIEIKRQLPIFLEITNHKRNIKKEPKINGSQVIVTTFLDIEEHKNMEIVYTSEIYIQVMKRLVKDSRNKIKELTTRK